MLPAWALQGYWAPLICSCLELRLFLEDSRCEDAPGGGIILGVSLGTQQGSQVFGEGNSPLWKVSGLWETSTQRSEVTDLLPVGRAGTDWVRGFGTGGGSAFYHLLTQVSIPDHTGQSECGLQYGQS